LEGKLGWQSFGHARRRGKKVGKKWVETRMDLEIDLLRNSPMDILEIRVGNGKVAEIFFSSQSLG
jgi:hypothetical protein